MQKGLRMGRVVGTVAAEDEAVDGILELLVDGFETTLEEPMLIVKLEGRMVLRVLLGDTLVNVAEVDIRSTEVALVAVVVTFDVTEIVGAVFTVFLGIAVLVIFEVERTCAVEVLETLTVAFK